MKCLVLAAATLLATAAPGRSARIASVSRIMFGPADTLFVADWAGSKVHAFKLPQPSPDAGKPFNILDLDKAISHAVGTSEVAIEDMADRPGSDEVYVAVSAGPERRPEVLVVRADGTARRLDLKSMKDDSVPLESPPDPALKFWNGLSARSFTVTDMK